MIKKIIVDNNLFKSGHYQLDDKFSARDWIDLEGLFKLEKKEFIEPVTSQIKDYVSDKKTVIGINYFGAVLASIIGYKYKKPFAYFFDGDKVVDSLEREINNIDQDGILLIMDVVVFGDALCRVTDSLFAKGIINEKTGVDCIILFERLYKRKNKDHLSKAYSNKFIHNIYTIDDNFNIELCEKNRDECIFRQGCKVAQCGNERKG